MKICYVNATYGVEDYKGGGLRTHLLTIPILLAKKGHQVTILTSGDFKQRERNLKVVQLSSLPLYEKPSQLLTPSYLFKRIRYMYKVYEYLSNDDFDIVEFADTGFEQLFCVFFQQKYSFVTRLHGSFTDVRLSPVNKFLFLLEKIVFTKSQFLVSPTNSYAEYSNKKYKTKRRVEIIPYGTENNIKYKKINIRKKYGLKGKKIILFVGMLSKRKGVDLLLKVARNIQDKRNVIFVLLGGNLENYDIGSLPINVQYLGHKNRDELHSFYSECSLLFSPTQFETFGLNIAEAMAHGKPVIASYTTGVKDLVQNKRNGFFFKMGDTIKASSLICKVIKNKKLSKKLGIESKKLAEQYKYNKILNQTTRFYESLTK